MLRLQLEAPEPASQGQCPQATSQQLLSATCDHINTSQSLNSTRPNPGPPDLLQLLETLVQEVLPAKGGAILQRTGNLAPSHIQFSAQFSRGQIEHAEPSSGVSSSL